MEGFSAREGSRIVTDLIKVIQDNKQYLSDLDGKIGDGDHGINMSKGAGLCAEELEKNPGDISHSLKTMSRTLMMGIGGAMGPLYGQFFRGMARACRGKEHISANDFGEMLKGAENAIRSISEAEVRDKTMMDTLVPATAAYLESQGQGKSLIESLEAMRDAARKGRDSTKDIVAKVGRSSRLGERSKGVLDAGAVSCCLILESIADSITLLIR